MGTGIPPKQKYISKRRSEGEVRPFSIRLLVICMFLRDPDIADAVSDLYFCSVGFRQLCQIF